jgi:hypothetical protein
MQLIMMLSLKSGQFDVVLDRVLHQFELSAGGKDVFLLNRIRISLQAAKFKLVKDLIGTDSGKLFGDALSLGMVREAYNFGVRLFHELVKLKSMFISEMVQALLFKSLSLVKLLCSVPDNVQASSCTL